MAAVAEQAQAVEEVAGGVLDFEGSPGWEPRQGGLFLLGAAVGLIGGALIGYGVAHKRLRTKYEAIAEEEISSMRDHFRAKLVAQEAKPDLEELAGVVSDLDYTAPEEAREKEPEVESIPDPKEVIHNVFDEHGDEWDYQKELAGRNENHPYVIHRDEMGEKDYLEQTFTYYEKDDVVCDSDDRVVDSADEVLGDFAEKFGHGSNDPNVVFIRNDRLGIDVELCRSPNSYAEEVHGLQHSEPMRRRPKFDDE